MGVLGRWFGGGRVPDVPQYSDICKLVFSWDARRLAKLMKHPDAGVRKSVVEVVGTIGRTRPTASGRPGVTTLRGTSETPLAPAMADFLRAYVDDPDPEVREAILTQLDDSKN